jgi:Ribbon-helix-helix domain
MTMAKKAKKIVTVNPVGAPSKPPELKTRQKAVLMLTDSQFERLKELSRETGSAVSVILREALQAKHPKIFRDK